MQFTDSAFLFLFLPLALLAHRFALVASGNKYSAAPRLCLFFSTLIFYGYSEQWWLVPFLICICFDFVWASLLSRSERVRFRKMILCLSIGQNLALLSVFKYWTFFTANIAAFSPDLAQQMAKLHEFIPASLPPGISFYTFESLSFVIDVYWGRVIPPKRADEFFAFIGMFPRFVAGPIVRYRDMVGQFSGYRGMRVQAGLVLFAFGLFLKCGFADAYAVFVPLAFDSGSPPGFGAAWIGSIAYAMQIYFDFYGYSLMAIGLGVCLGFQFPTNFNRPYLASDLQDFWRRWHISLSTWLRDYLYVPLGGSRKGKVRTYINLFLTMLIGGAWHGANWTFIVWGALHGGWLCVERMALGFAPAWTRRLLMLWVVLVGWVFFRSENMGQALSVLASMTAAQGDNVHLLPLQSLVSDWGAAISCSCGLVFCFYAERFFDAQSLENLEAPTPWQWSAALLLFAATVPIGSPDLPPTPFLYFQF